MATDKFGKLILWTPIDPITVSRYDVVPEAAVRFAELMENMSSADLAQAVPYIHIYELNVNGGLGRRISTDLYQPPKFGQPLDHPFAERPDVSIENVKVKYHQPQGWILWREMDLSLVVHRPDKVFSAATGSLMQSLLDFTKEHVIVYGWTGGSTVIAHGPPPENPDPIPPDLTRKSGLVDYRKGLRMAHDPVPGTQDSVPPNYRQVMPVKAVIKFKVTNYNFQIEPDMQVKFQLHAVEDGELASRDAVLFNNRQILPLFDDPSITIDDAERLFDKAKETFVQQLKIYTKPMKVDITDKKTGKASTQQDQFIRLEDVFDIFLADPLVYACRSLGYSDVHLNLGLFNKDCPKTTAAYGSQEYALKSVGDFWMPLKVINDMLARMTTKNTPMTAYGMIREICQILNSADVWSTNATDKKRIPEMALRTRYNVDSSFALFQLMDRKYFIANTKVGDLNVWDVATKSNLRKVLRKANIPTLRFMTKLSYLKNIKFEVVNDEQMKSIFIRRQVDKSRTEIAASDNRNSQLYGGMPGFSMLYRSAIRGTVEMLGNFAFEVFGIIYVDFGIPAYNGGYYIISREDTISAEGFYTSLTLQAVGSDPLFDGKRDPLPKWITGGGERSMYDWVKSMIVETHPPQPQLAKSH